MTLPLHMKSAPEQRAAPGLKFKRTTASEGIIEGYASVFGGRPDAYGDVVAPGAYKRTLAEHKAAGTMPSMFWMHNPSSPVGRWTEMKEDDRGLFAIGQLNLSSTAGKEALAHVEHGDVDGLSIGFIIPPTGKRMLDDGSRLLTDLDLLEVSIVTLPANQRTRITGSKQLGSKADLIALLRDGGLSKTAAQRIAGGGWPALDSQDHQKTIDLAERIARATASLRTP